jgi:precorrin-3B synthase
MRPLARALTNRLTAQRPGAELPAKFSIVLDGGGRLSLARERADIRTLACAAGPSAMIAIATGDDNWLGMTEPENAATSISAIIAGDSPKLQPVETLNVQIEYIPATWGEILPFGADCHIVSVGVPFGCLESGQLRVLSEISAELRLSPWRMLFIPAPDHATAEQLVAIARKAGFAGASDVRMHIQACPGRPACMSAHADTRLDAEIAARCMEESGFEGTVHLSGCAKGCASSAPADITLVGVPGGYRLMLRAAARDEGGTMLAPSDLPATMNALMQGRGHG